VTDAQKVNGNWSEETLEVAGTEHPVCIRLGQSGDHVHRGPSATRWNGPSAVSMGVLVIIGRITDRDTPRNTSLKGMIDQKERTRKKQVMK
jgi:hypothetical protein